MEFSSTISFNKNSPLFWNLEEQYLHITNTSYQVTQINGKTISLKEDDTSTSRWFVKALKIASFATIIIPLFALTTKAIYRSKYSYEIKYSTIKIHKEFDVWKKVFEKHSFPKKETHPYFKLFSSHANIPHVSVLETALFSRKTFSKSCVHINELVAFSLTHLTTHPDSSEALTAAKTVYKKLAAFLQNNTDKKLSESYSKAYSNHNQNKLIDNYYYREKLAKTLEISLETFEVFWQLLKNLRKQIKYIEKQEKLKSFIKESPYKQGLSNSNLSWIHGTKAIVLKLACEQTKQKILPSGKLQQKKTTILTGEMGIGATTHGVNKKTISGTGLLDGERALNYAKDYFLDLDKDMNSYKALLDRRVSFVKNGNFSFSINVFLDNGNFTKMISKVQHIRDLRNAEFQKNLPQLKELIETIEKEIHLYIFRKKPNEIFKWHDSYYTSDFYNFLNALSKLRELAENPTITYSITEEDLKLSEIPLVLGSTTRCGFPFYNSNGFDIQEENIPGSIKLGKDIQVVFTPTEYITKVQGIINQYGLSASVRVETIDSLKSTIQLEKELEGYFYDVYR